MVDAVPRCGVRAAGTGLARRPGDIAEANQNPDTFADKSVGQVVGHNTALIERLDQTPAVVGHSFGGLFAQILAGKALSAATVAIDPAPFRGVLPLPVSALRAGSPVLGHPTTRHRAVPLTYQQFRYAFANAVDEDEAKALYDEFAVPAPARPLWQAAVANLNPRTEASVAFDAPDRGPLLIIRRQAPHGPLGDRPRHLPAGTGTTPPPPRSSNSPDAATP